MMMIWCDRVLSKAENLQNQLCNLNQEKQVPPPLPFVRWRGIFVGSKELMCVREEEIIPQQLANKTALNFCHLSFLIYNLLLLLQEKRQCTFFALRRLSLDKTQQLFSLTVALYKDSRSLSLTIKLYAQNSNFALYALTGAAVVYFFVCFLRFLLISHAHTHTMIR